MNRMLLAAALITDAGRRERLISDGGVNSESPDCDSTHSDDERQFLANGPRPWVHWAEYRSAEGRQGASAASSV